MDIIFSFRCSCYVKFHGYPTFCSLILKKVQGESKKIRHFFSHPTSNRNNSKTVCQNHLKIDVQGVPHGDSLHSDFYVNRTNRFRVIAVKSWMRKKCLIFFDSPCTNPKRQRNKSGLVDKKS